MTEFTLFFCVFRGVAQSALTSFSHNITAKKKFVNLRNEKFYNFMQKKRISRSMLLAERRILKPFFPLSAPFSLIFLAITLFYDTL